MDLHYVQGEPLFTRTYHVPRQYPYLTQDLETDVVIIGGGVTGSIVGYYLSEKKIPAVLLEKHRIGFGSTSVTTALLQYELDSNARELEQYTPLESIKTSYQLGIKALEELKTFIENYGNACHYEVKDTLVYTSKEAEIGLMKSEYEVRKHAGLDVSYIEADTHNFSFDLKAGVYGHQGGAQLDPYQYTHQLLDVATSKGLKVYENTGVECIEYLKDCVEITTWYGYKIKAKKVILATGYDTDRFTKRNFGVKTTTYNVVTEPVSTFEGWENRVLIRDNQDPYHYLRTTYDNRIVCGGEDISFNPGIFDETSAQKKYQLLEARIKEMFPKILDIKIAYKYCGAFASTQDNLGFIGPDPDHPNLWYCLGYGANGILFAILGGMMLSDLYLGIEDGNMRLFKVDRFDGK